MKKNLTRDLKCKKKNINQFSEEGLQRKGWSAIWREHKYYQKFFLSFLGHPHNSHHSELYPNSGVTPPTQVQGGSIAVKYQGESAVS